MSTDLDALHAAARAGQPGAMTMLAKRILAGEGGQESPEEAVALLARAAQRDGEAASLMARVLAWGALRPRDMEKSLGLLAHAAALGWAAAQAELRFLAQGSGADWSADWDADWDALRKRIDLDAWTKPPLRRELSSKPRMRVFEGFASAAECDGWSSACAASCSVLWSMMAAPRRRLRKIAPIPRPISGYWRRILSCA